jgi:hypothetical protein
VTDAIRLALADVLNRIASALASPAVLARMREHMPPIGSIELLSGPAKGNVIPIHSGDIAGRDTDNDIVLDSTRASRKHVMFGEEGGNVFVRDLGSANGMFVDGRPAGRSQLKGGETIFIGDIQLRYHAKTEVQLALQRMSKPAPALLNDEPPRALPATVVPAAEEGPSLAVRGRLLPAPAPRPLVEDNEDLIATVMISPPEGDPNALEATLAYNMSNRFRAGGPDRAAQLERRLKLVLAILGALGSTKERGELLKKIVDELFDVFPQTIWGSILLGPSAEALASSFSRHRDHRAPDVEVSRTLMKRVLERKEAILSLNAASDDRLDGATIARLPTRSIMVAPLLFGREALGLIYVQSGDARRFERDDLDLLAGLASCVAVFLKRVEAQESPPLEELETSERLPERPPIPVEPAPVEPAPKPVEPAPERRLELEG